jgi:hypothetical protein
MTKRAMVKLIHADGFFPKGDSESYANTVRNLKFEQKPYGKEIQDFNMILHGMEPVFSRVLGEKVVIEPLRSGIFRKPSQFVHFEEFDTLNEWCFVVALEKTTFNTYHHLQSGFGESGMIDAKTALDGYQFNYQNLLEWNVENNVVLEPNQGVFFRPWVFHSLTEGKLVQYYRLMTDKVTRTLIMGLPGSGKSEIAEKVQRKLENSVLVSSIEERLREKDVDFTRGGVLRHSYRMLDVCREKKVEYVVIDMVAPIPEAIEILNPDVIIWVNTREKSEFDSANEMFTKPKEYDIMVKTVTDEVIDDIAERARSKRANLG